MSECKLTSGSQKAVHHSEGSIVGRWFNFQQSAHQRINVDAVKRLRYEVLLEVGPKAPENRLHVHLFIVVAMITNVDIKDESLMGTDESEDWGLAEGFFDRPFCEYALTFTSVLQMNSMLFRHNFKKVICIYYKTVFQLSPEFFFFMLLKSVTWSYTVNSPYRQVGHEI